MYYPAFYTTLFCQCLRVAWQILLLSFATAICFGQTDSSAHADAPGYDSLVSQAARNYAGTDSMASQTDVQNYSPDDSLKSPADIPHLFIYINKIEIEGNKITRPQYMLREITFSEGDSIATDLLMKQLEESRNHLFNTGLFNEVVLNIKSWDGNKVVVLVSVKERWYTFPLPSFDLYDRNFNVWWVDHDHELKWIQVGMRFYQHNVRGRGEDLKIVALFGFSQRFETQYSIPYVDKAQKNGLRFGISYSRSRNLTYAFSENKELIYQNIDEFQKRNFFTAFEWIHKPAYNSRYSFAIGYNDNAVTDTIADLNPDYYLNGQTRQQYFSARVAFTRDLRDYRVYPLTGSYLEIAASKLGFGLFDNVNIYSTTATYSKYFHFGKKWYLSTQNKVKFSFPKIQPYSLSRGLGYGGDYVSGYEYYVVDGQSWGLTKLNLRNEIFKIKIKTPPRNPFLKGATIPIAVYGRAYVDAGYVKDDYYYENNPLNNSFLLGGGVALDITLIYDTTIRLEYSINKLGEKGFFLHMNSLF
jgi:hypothetical protein